MNVKQLIAQGHLSKEPYDKRLVDKELQEAAYDLEMAQKTLEDDDYKWTTVKAYYAAFHASRAVLFTLGLREKKHFAISVVLDDLQRKGLLEKRFVDDFAELLTDREQADYHYSYSETDAKRDIALAEGFIERMQMLVMRLAQGSKVSY